MTQMQTCRRHPEAGAFMATCSGCARELYDIEQANRAEAQARTALALIGTPDVEILSVHATETTLVVATRQPDAFYPYAVDAFRLPTADESDPEVSDDYRLPAGQWVLAWQAGDFDDSVAAMVDDARQYLARSAVNA